MSTAAIIRHEEVNVCGSNILATVTQDNKCYFSPRHVCQALGISWQGQHEKIKADPVLGGCVKEILTHDSIGRKQMTIMLPIEFLSGWLFTIKKVAPEVQAKLNLYRAEGFRALDAWFRQGLRSDPALQQPKYTIPTSLAEALRLYADEVEKTEKLTVENQIMTPKAKRYDRFMDADGTLNLSQAAKALDLPSGRALGLILRRDLGWLFLDTKQVLPKASVLKKGYMTTKLWAMDDRQKSGVQGRITAKGLEYLMEYFGIEEEEAA